MSGNSTSSSVTVCVRLRPFLPREHRQQAVVHVNGNTVNIQEAVDQLYGDPKTEQRQFVFDICLGSDTSQATLYGQIGHHILQNTLAGFNGTIFAYGQTGSGKSFSIMGPDADPGVIPRVTRELFSVVEHDKRDEPAAEIRITMSFLEIYNEDLKDLLDPRPRQKKLYVHQHPKLGVYVPHLTEAAASSAAECVRLLDFGSKVRATAQTNMNSTSSRSHSVCTLRLTQVFPGGKLRNSAVHLCDLAGSERVKKSGASGQRMREGSSINNSLSVLGQVISKLAAGAEKKGVHVPFRQSKLTHLLTDALSGNSVTTMLATVSPARSEAEESLGTLRFAESVKKVKTKPQLTELTPEEPALLLESFRSEIGVLEKALKKEDTSLPDRQLHRAMEANQQLMSSISRRCGAREGWAEAVEQTKALEAMQQHMLEEMSLRVHEVGQLAGVACGTPYLLNISDDPALSGRLLYFLRADPEVTTVGEAGPGSAAPNSIVLQGVGIPACLCEISFSSSAKEVQIRRKFRDSERGRLLVNGKPLASDLWHGLKHGDRLVFGWAFCFRLILSTEESRAGSVNEADGAMFEHASREVLEYTMTSTMSDMSVMRAATHWQGELRKRGVSAEESEALMDAISELMVQVEEANALCGELERALPSALPVDLDVGMCFSFLPRSRPAVVVQVWARRPEPELARLVAAWPPADFERRLVELRDAHREVAKKERHKEWAQRLSCGEWWSGNATLRAPGELGDSDAEDAATTGKRGT